MMAARHWLHPKLMPNAQEKLINLKASEAKQQSKQNLSPSRTALAL